MGVFMHRRHFLQGLGLGVGLFLVRTEAFAVQAERRLGEEDELEAHPRCVICNMDRRKFHFARHLIVYGDDLVQGTCSIHCAAECMLHERRRGFANILAPDYGQTMNPRPLFEAAAATYLIGSDLPGVMTPVSKVAFADPGLAQQAQSVYGGELGSFSTALNASFAETAASLLRRYANDRERAARRARQPGSNRPQ